MSIWVLPKYFLEMNHNIMDLLTKNQSDPVCCLGEKLKSSPTGKLAMHVVKGVATLNSLINPSCMRVATCLRGFEWCPRRQLDMRDMCPISRSSIMTCFKRHLSQQTRSQKIGICYVFVGIFCNRLLNRGESYLAPWFRPPRSRERSFTIYEMDFEKERVGFMIQERRELEEQFQLLICKPGGLFVINISAIKDS